MPTGNDSEEPAELDLTPDQRKVLALVGKAGDNGIAWSKIKDEAGLADNALVNIRKLLLGQGLISQPKKRGPYFITDKGSAWLKADR